MISGGQFVVFRLASEEFAVSIDQVQEIIRWKNVTKLPHLPDFIQGIIGLRGLVMPVVSLRKRLGYGDGDSKSAKVIIIELQGNPVGLMVDSVEEVLTLASTEIQDPPSGITASHIQGIGRLDDRLIILLDLAAVFSGEEKAELAAVDNLEGVAQ